LFAQSLPFPSNFRIIYSEQALDLFWDSVPQAVGYHIYSAERPNQPLANKRRINPSMITSGPHFTYIWDVDNTIRERKIKGYGHYISITSLFLVQDSLVESAPSQERDDDYFRGFSQINTSEKLNNCFLTAHHSPLLLPNSFQNKKAAFISFMDGPGRLLDSLIGTEIDPHQVGGCAPISTLLLSLLNDFNLIAYRAEGSFIHEYHSFNLINIEGIEYIIDFSSDQFIPKSQPVFFPRVQSFLNQDGKLDTVGQPIYTIARLYSPEQSTLSDNKDADIYKSIYKRVIAHEKHIYRKD